MAKKVILGFSGGLDTSYCVKYLSEDKGYEVHSIIVNTGGFTDEELKSKITLKTLPVDLLACDEVFFRADIHATTNEVQEQFEQLHPADKPVPEISFNGASFHK